MCEQVCHNRNCHHHMLSQILFKGTSSSTKKKGAPIKGKAKETEASMEFGNCMLMLTRSFTLEEIGEMWGLTRERIRQIEERALGKLRSPVNLRRMREVMEECGEPGERRWKIGRHRRK